MLAFCAYWKGKVKGNTDEFDHYVRKVHLPLVAEYPNLKKLRYLKGIPKEGVPPKYFLSFELFFDSWEAFEVAKHSVEREVAVADAEKLQAMFEGEVHHVIYEVDDIPCGSSSS